jgi:hypothetical protein
MLKRNQLVIAPVFGTFIGNLKSLAQDIENFILSKESNLSKETVPFIGIVNPPRHTARHCIGNSSNTIVIALSLTILGVPV